MNYYGFDTLKTSGGGGGGGKWGRPTRGGANTIGEDTRFEESNAIGVAIRFVEGNTIGKDTRFEEGNKIGEATHFVGDYKIGEATRFESSLGGLFVRDGHPQRYTSLAAFARKFGLDKNLAKRLREAKGDKTSPTPAVKLSEQPGAREPSISPGSRRSRIEHLSAIRHQEGGCQ